MFVFTTILTYLAGLGNNTNKAVLNIKYIKEPGIIISSQQLCATSHCITPDIINTNSLYFNSTSMFLLENIKKKAPKTCKTIPCIIAAYKINQNMDNDEDPCNHFYNYACGSFIKFNSLLYSTVSDTFFNRMRQDIPQQKTNVLKDFHFDNIVPARHKPAKLLFDACLDTNSINSNSEQSLLDLLTKLGGWPVIEHQWDANSVFWYDILYHCRNLGCPIDSLLSIGAKVSKGERYITIDTPKFIMKEDYYFNPKIMQSYLKVMTKIAFELKEATIIDHINEELNSSMTFEVELVKIAQSQPENKAFQIKDLEKKIPKFPWLTFSQKIMGSKYNVTKEQNIYIENLEYVHNLTELLRKTPKRVIANYMIWRVVAYMFSFVSANKRQPLVQFLTSVGAFTYEENEDKCYYMTNDLTPLSLSFLYAEEYFDSKMTTIVSETVNDVKQAFRDLLKDMEWLTEYSRNKTKLWIDSFGSTIGYPTFLNSDVVDQYFSEIQLTTTNLINLVLVIKKFDYDYFYRKPWEQENSPTCGKNQDFISYSSCTNSLDIPITVLQDIMFSVDRPAYLNYGSLGFYISLKMLHALSQKVKEEYIWDYHTLAGYFYRGKCLSFRNDLFIYEEFPLELINFTLRYDLVMDNDAASIAYRAYELWTKRHGEEEIKLPSLENYKPKQLFWISLTNIMCIKQTYDEAKILMNRGIPTNKLRILGLISNNKDFALNFVCPRNSRMNPQEKCKI